MNRGPDDLVILIATDNHLGYLEKDPIRGDDSLVTFEEILKIAVEQDVDMVLLGGDLYHDNKPSRNVLFKSMNLFKKYCMASLENLSDQEAKFKQNGETTPNYLDPNLNISLPIFSIHGNHDDPAGDGGLCALDLLNVSGFVNYFGKSRNVDAIEIDPILLRKGETKLALYGLGNVRDERLNSEGMVKFMRPPGKNEYFNLFTIHQNRYNHIQRHLMLNSAAHSPKNYVRENFIGGFMDFVLWGHEHECRIRPEWNEEQQFCVVQPGSSVATSLSEGESIPKKVGIMTINKKEYKLEEIPLRTTRPFIMEQVVLKEVKDLDPKDVKSVEMFLRDRVKGMIAKADAEWIVAHPIESETNAPPKPLIRLKVEYSGTFEVLNPHRFGHAFIHKVANPKDILLFYRIKTNVIRSTTLKHVIPDPYDVILEPLDTFNVTELVSEYLATQTLSVLPEKRMTESVLQFVEKDEKDSIKQYWFQEREGVEGVQAYKNEMKELKMFLELDNWDDVPEKVTEETKDTKDTKDTKETVDDMDVDKDMSDSGKGVEGGASENATAKIVAPKAMKKTISELIDAGDMIKIENDPYADDFTQIGNVQDKRFKPRKHAYSDSDSEPAKKSTAKKAVAKPRATKVKPKIDFSSDEEEEAVVKSKPRKAAAKKSAPIKSESSSDEQPRIPIKKRAASSRVKVESQRVAETQFELNSDDELVESQSVKKKIKVADMLKEKKKSGRTLPFK